MLIDFRDIIMVKIFKELIFLKDLKVFKKNLKKKMNI